MENKFKFTQSRLDQLSCPSGKARVYFQDEARPELQLQITSKGAKSYYCRCWNRAKGYTDRIYIGKFEQLDLKEAKSRARELANLAGQGRASIIRPKPVEHNLTFSEAFESFITEPANRKKKGPRREATTRTYSKQYSCHLSHRFKSRRLSTINAAEIDEIHTEIGNKSGTYAANRVVTLISGVFNDAISKGWQGKNRTQGIERFLEKRRTRFLEEHELGPFIRACEIERESGSQAIGEAVLMALFTGLRRINICGAAWQHIDLEHGTWNIPAMQMKNDEPHLVYLCDYLKSLLTRRFKYRTCDEWVFPGASRTGHLVEPQRGVTRIAVRAKINPRGVNMHCLKHTFITYADDLGLPSAVRKRLAAHKGSRNVTDGYTHAREGRVCEAYEKVAQHMLGFSKGL